MYKPDRMVGLYADVVSWHKRVTEMVLVNTDGVSFEGNSVDINLLVAGTGIGYRFQAGWLHLVNPL